MDKRGLSRDCGGKMEKEIDKSNLIDDPTLRFPGSDLPRAERTIFN